MGLLDKLLGRGKKAAGDMADSAMAHDEGMHQSTKAWPRRPRPRWRSTSHDGTRAGRARTLALLRRRPTPSLAFRGPMWIVVFILLSLGALAAGAVWFLRNLRTELGTLRADAGAEAAERSAAVDRRLEAMTSTLDRRLESTSKTAGDIHRQLGELGRANEEILARANDLKRLEQALRPPKARGGFGELLLANLLRDRLPAGAYELQYGVPRRPAGRCRDQGRQARPRRRQVPARQLRAAGRGRGRRAPHARREGFRARPEDPRRRDRGEVHPTRRGNVRLRAHVPAFRGRLLRARLREDRRAALVRARQAGLPGLADDVHVAAPGDRPRA